MFFQNGFAGRGIERGYINFVAASFLRDGPRDDDVDAFAHGNEFRKRSVHVGGTGLEPRGYFFGLAAVVRGDERCALQRNAQHRFERSVEDRVSGFVVKISDQQRQRGMDG